MPYKDDLDAELGGSVSLGYPADKAMRRLFGFRGSAVLQEHPTEGFEILNAVAERFALPFRTVQVVGSAHTGYTYFKQRDFVLKESDLDLAIVDARLFTRYSETSFLTTRGYTDLTAFREDRDAVRKFHGYLVRGVLRPDLMPQCTLKQDWFTFFNRLSEKYADLFLNINCGIYLSDAFFEAKQVPLYAKYKEDQQ